MATRNDYLFGGEDVGISRIGKIGDAIWENCNSEFWDESRGLESESDKGES